MLKPSMSDLMKKVGNRYLLVNLAAQRARDISDEAKESGNQLPEKAVKLALDEIVNGSIVYCEGPREPKAAMPEVAPALDTLLDLDDDVVVEILGDGEDAAEDEDLI